MKPLDKMKLLRFAVYGVVIALLFVVGTTPGIIPELWGAKPSLMVVTAMCIALMGEGEISSMVFGIVCGLLADYSQGTIYGFNAVILAILCYFTALLVNGLFQKGILSAVFIMIIALAIVFILRWLFTYVVMGYGSYLYALVYHYAIPAGYTLVSAVPIYAMFRGLSYLLRSQRVT